jgi:hypothetical protein
MNDEFLHRLRKPPRPAFAALLRAELARQPKIQPRRRGPPRARTFILLLSLGGAAFAVTMAVRGIPPTLLQLFHHAASPVATAPRTVPPFGVGSLHASLVPAPGTLARTFTAPPGAPASTPVQSTYTEPAAASPAKPAHWEYFLRRDSAPLLRGWTHPGLPVGWQVRHGVLSKSGMVENLESTREYRDFELELEWNIGRAGDSGIFYRATHEYPEIYWSGPEYQLLDDYDSGDVPRTMAAGSVFDMYPSPAGVEAPYGYWNSTRIIVRGNDVEYWLNGHLIVSYTLGSPDWLLRVKDSKFEPYPDYGRAPQGLIGLQGDNRGSIEFRNMRIRQLP